MSLIRVMRAKISLWTRFNARTSFLASQHQKLGETRIKKTRLHLSEVKSPTWGFKATCLLYISGDQYVEIKQTLLPQPRQTNFCGCGLWEMHQREPVLQRRPLPITRAFRCDSPTKANRHAPTGSGIWKQTSKAQLMMFRWTFLPPVYSVRDFFRDDLYAMFRCRCFSFSMLSVHFET